MSPADTHTHDLIVLAADKDAEFAMRGILRRAEALRIRPVKVDFIVHPEHDPGCLLRSSDLLRAFLRSHRYACVVLDREGAGREKAARATLEEKIEEQLGRNGWQSRCAAVVIDPELETWVWSDSPEVDRWLGWTGRQPTLREWLRAEGFLPEGSLKPSRPKEAVQKALRIAAKPRSSSLYRHLAENVSLDRCTDAAMQKLRETLRLWFPAD